MIALTSISIFSLIVAAVCGLPVIFIVGEIGAPIALPRPVENIIICEPPPSKPVIDSHAADGVFIITSPGFVGGSE